ncbi:uncharacterized protein LOC132739625 [Ruditapes philippinarum]|uniref:uncharacterized protein LOC132739625 n=1 Tax=Ruditapes philippinarum TaxID=129788 RepID=UPI00295A9156|nr:uncharacterized protein LOC132739625 [Ruditapes philippinarum]
MYNHGLEDYLKWFYSRSERFYNFCHHLERFENLILQVGPRFGKLDIQRKEVTVMNQYVALTEIMQTPNYLPESLKPILILTKDTTASAHFIVSFWLNIVERKTYDTDLETLDGVFLLKVEDSDDVTDLNIMMKERFKMKKSYYSQRKLIIFECIHTDIFKLKKIYNLACSCEFISCNFIIITKIEKQIVLDLKLHVECFFIADKIEALRVFSIRQKVWIDGQKLSKSIDQIVSKRNCILWQKDTITKICFENIHPLNDNATICVPKDIKSIEITRCCHNIRIMHFAYHLDILQLGIAEKTFQGNTLTSTLTTVVVNFELTDHIFNRDVYESFAFGISKATHIKSLHLCNMKFGRKCITVELQEKSIEKVRHSIESKEDYCRFGACILGPHLGNISFDKEDVRAEERNSFVQQIMLDLICYELVKTNSSVSECYPSEMKDGAIKLICFVNDEVRIDFFKGFPLLKRDCNYISKESLLAENSCDREDNAFVKATEEEFVDINETLSFHAEALMTSHRNLEAVKVSFVQPKEVKLAHSKLCIVLYCRVKGHKPYGDPSFPQSLNHPFKCKTFRTDVREGYFSTCPGHIGRSTDFNKTLALGCSIGETDGNLAATLGPFVNIRETNETCFLTVRHVFAPTSRTDNSLTGVKVVQPADVHLTPGAVVLPNRQCGEVIASQKGEQIDASIVKISPERLPTSGQFIQLTNEDLNFAGLTEEPTYNDAEFMDAKTLTVKDQATRRIIKIGSTTSLTKGTLSTTDGCVRETLEYSTIETLYNGTKETLQITSQLMVDSYYKKVFCQAGDSGSAVFLVDDDNHLHCIGMLIGVICSDLTAIVTPIDNILKILSHRLGKTLELKKFRETDEMDES